MSDEDDAEMLWELPAETSSLVADMSVSECYKRLFWFDREGLVAKG